MTVGSQVKGCFASIKNVEASLETLANKVQDVESKKAYSEVQQIVSEIKDDLGEHIIHLAREEPQYK